VALVGRKKVPGIAPANQSSFELALFPIVVFVDASVAGSTSHGRGEAAFAITRSQPCAFSQHQTSRVSVDGYWYGKLLSLVTSGKAGKTFHVGLSARLSMVPSR
jgi:hypothetical protein